MLKMLCASIQNLFVWETRHSGFMYRWYSIHHRNWQISARRKAFCQYWCL